MESPHICNYSSGESSLVEALSCRVLGEPHRERGDALLSQQVLPCHTVRRLTRLPSGAGGVSYKVNVLSHHRVRYHDSEQFLCLTVKIRPPMVVCLRDGVVWWSEPSCTGACLDYKKPEGDFIRPELQGSAVCRLAVQYDNQLQSIYIYHRSLSEAT